MPPAYILSFVPVSKTCVGMTSAKKFTELAETQQFDVIADILKKKYDDRVKEWHNANAHRDDALRRVEQLESHLLRIQMKSGNSAHETLADSLIKLLMSNALGDRIITLFHPDNAPLELQKEAVHVFKFMEGNRKRKRDV